MKEILVISISDMARAWPRIWLKDMTTQERWLRRWNKAGVHVYYPKALAGMISWNPGGVNEMFKDW